MRCSTQIDLWSRAHTHNQTTTESITPIFDTFALKYFQYFAVQKLIYKIEFFLPNQFFWCSFFLNKIKEKKIHVWKECVRAKNYDSSSVSCCFVWIRWHIWGLEHNSMKSVIAFQMYNDMVALIKIHMAMATSILRIFYVFNGHTFDILCLQWIHIQNLLFQWNRHRWHCSSTIFCHVMVQCNHRWLATLRVQLLNFYRLVENWNGFLGVLTIVEHIVATKEKKSNRKHGSISQNMCCV